MSASNWAVCPRCLGEAERTHLDLQERAIEAYGNVSVEEFDAIRSEAAKPIDREALRTFREDYEFYGASEGFVVATYSGSCEKCGLDLDFRHEHRFWPPGDSGSSAP